MTDYTLMHGDCLDVMAGMEATNKNTQRCKMPGVFVRRSAITKWNLVITDVAADGIIPQGAGGI